MKISIENAKMTSSDKVCMVCGDKSLGYNFNAVTCESCKAFFRRNALSSKEFTCPFTDNCDISVVTRRFCQKCRLEKCFSIGMKKEYIMSEEDKILKKMKIEQNRAKRKPSASNQQVTVPQKIKRENGISLDGDSWEGCSSSNRTNTLSPTASSNSSNSRTEPFTPSSSFDFNDMFPVISSSTNTTEKIVTKPFPDSHSTSSEIVEQLVDYPEDASKFINQLMKTPKEAVDVMTKILSSQKDAMRLIGHLISQPGDALKIISKIMNSPFDALTVFTKFMSSPTDALEIIAKIASSPNEVLQFIKQLMNSPEDALQIMNKFMNSPAEALKMLNKMVNHTNSVDSTTKCKEEPTVTIEVDDVDNTATSLQSPVTSIANNPMIKSMLDNQLSDSPNSAIVSPAREENKDHQEIDKIDSPESSETLHSILHSMNDFSVPQHSSLESVIDEAIKLEYETVNSLAPSTSNNRELNDAERAKLNELIVANKALYAPLDEDLSGLDECSIKANQNSQDPQLLKIINLTAIAIRRLIKMSKKINAFKNMCQEDQVALLKGGCTEMMILRSVMQYDDGDRCTWKIPHSEEAMSSITVDVLKLAKGNVYEAHESFIRTFEPRWRQDENIILILCAIVLFTPGRPKTIHSDVLKLEQNSYYYLLRRYLESVYPGCVAKSTFLKLMQKIIELQRLNEVIISVYLDVNPSQVEPLLREIFDLKNH
ncbi:Nuclear hormone receptor HR96 [Pseudolycoriella hygida]|uniref:Nuclear hormone receptor HR96 n=1 Tax=Pseudolycoriella hygida TaxID=35572 RepID=A0A9Q0MTY8_9DIPT|nr:Nuclear hormone receptor HR96 [Pseudolycoriella hygida]